MRFNSIRLSVDSGGVSLGYTLPTLTLPVATVDSTQPYVVKNVDGFDPPEATVNILQTANAGSVFQSRRPQDREVVMQIGFQPNYATGQTHGDLRSSFYEWITSKIGLPLSLSLLDAASAVIVSVPCYVKRCESNIFSKDPEMIVTFSCVGTFFNGPNYSYPGVPLVGTPLTIVNPGNGPTPFTMVFKPNTNAAAISMVDRMGNRFQITWGPFVSTDLITIETRPGQRSVVNNRSGTLTNLLPYQTNDSKWPVLHGGTNLFDINPSVASIQSLTLYPKYWGV